MCVCVIVPMHVLEKERICEHVCACTCVHTCTWKLMAIQYVMHTDAHTQYTQDSYDCTPPLLLLGVLSLHDQGRSGDE